MPAPDSTAPDFTVSQYGADAYGRPVFMTAFMHDWFEDYVAELGWRPRILQGCFMERLGGGAVASDGAHDKGKCLDLETEGRSVAEIDLMVATARKAGAGAYRRDRTRAHGSMTPHMHLTLGADEPGSPMAEILWSSYVGNGDGLAIQPPQHDYEWRPDPLVLTPPEDPMADYAGLLDDISKKLDASKKRDIALRKSIKALGEMVTSAAEGASTDVKRRIAKSERDLLAALAEADQVDGQ